MKDLIKVLKAVIPKSFIYTRTETKDSLTHAIQVLERLEDREKLALILLRDDRHTAVVLRPDKTTGIVDTGKEKRMRQAQALQDYLSEKI